MIDLGFYNKKKVLITGHTGFKGTWLCQILLNLGAEITGYALEAPTNPNLFSLSKTKSSIQSVEGDIRDYKHLQEIISRFRPEIIFHLAAQPIVRSSYDDPIYTYETNVMGTVNLLECVRKQEFVRSVVNVTTDKVYDNREWDRGYCEEDYLDGFDPYSNSKSCSELVTHSYKRAFFAQTQTAVSTARAGNVIGGGDFAKDRIIPDCIRAAEKKELIIVRNPFSVRPYQHVLDPLMAYLMIAQKQHENIDYAGCYNVGPDDEDCATTGQIVDLFCEKWGDIQWVNRHDGGPHEAKFLKLNCDKLKKALGWMPHWNLETAVDKVVEWTKCYLSGEDVNKIMDKQIGEFISG